jgi:hypothetical protein
MRIKNNKKTQNIILKTLEQYTITTLGRGEYPKLSTQLGLFPRGQRAVTVLLY